MLRHVISDLAEHPAINYGYAPQSGSRENAIADRHRQGGVFEPTDK
jgi:hypothetical protein